MIVLVSGDRKWTNRDAIRWELAKLGPYTIIVHGKCHLGGADIIAGEIALELGMKVKECPADWKKWGKAAGPKRNQEMLDLYQPEFALLFHNHMAKSKGTRDMLQRVIAAGVDYKIVTDLTYAEEVAKAYSG